MNTKEFPLLGLMKFWVKDKLRNMSAWLHKTDRV